MSRKSKRFTVGKVYLPVQRVRTARSLLRRRRRDVQGSRELVHIFAVLGVAYASTVNVRSDRIAECERGLRPLHQEGIAGNQIRKQNAEVSRDFEADPESLPLLRLGGLPKVKIK